MDNVRFALISAAGVILFFMWQAWQSDYADITPPPRAQEQTQEYSQAPADDALAKDEVPDIGSAPEASAQQSQKKSGTNAPGALASGERIHVVTDKFDIYIDTRGGDIRQADLIGVPLSEAHPEQPMRILSDQPPNFFIAQNGLVGGENPPDHRDLFQSQRAEYRLEKDQDSITVPLTWTSGDGREVTKVYTFYRDSYRVGLRHEVVNNSENPWTVSQYLRFWRLPYEGAEKPPFSQTFMGVAWYQQKEDSQDYRFEKIKAEDLNEEPLKTQQTGGWVSLMQHYFVGAVIPPKDQVVSYFAEGKPVPGTAAPGFAGGYVSQRQEIPAGESRQLSADLYIGPKLQDQLDATAPGLQLTIDYGFLAVISKPLFWVLDTIHSFLGNWGISIILLTVLIKLCFYKLSETQYRAMARMRKFGPRIKQIKEQYGDDKEKLQAKMMDLYKKEGFNPLGGCWPMLVQMPVFLALYWVLLESVELRHAPFALWINDLSSPDPFYILPVLFGITMWFQQKLSMQTMTMDPMQARMMQFMPVGMAVFFAFFPSGLVLYWFTNNLLSIAQQWYIYRKLDQEGLGHKAPAK